ncbi:MAG: serpin family protein [Saprospiraceae bacterium]
MHSFILEIFKTIIQKEKNVLLSPFCFEIIINIIAQGTTGESQKELLELLNSKNSSNSYPDLIKKLELIKKIQPTSQFEQANTIFHKDFVIPVDLFCKKIRKHHILNLEPVPEEYKDSCDFIIQSSLDIKAKWKQEFDLVNHQTEFFTLANGEEVETSFINQDNTEGRNETLFFQNENFHAIQIPLKDEQLCVEIYLPEKKNGLNNFVKNLTVENLLEWNNNFEKVEYMEVVLPKIELDKNYELKENFKAIGLNDIFNLSWDLLPMLNTPAETKITKITQENFFKLNEIGIEAGSKTRFYGGIRGISRMKQHILFEAKHPFMYLVRDKKTNTIIFLGLFEEPNREQDFSILHKNLEESKKYDKSYSHLSYRLSFVITAYSLDVLMKHFNCKNEFVSWYIDKIWALIATPKGEKFDEICDDLNWFCWDKIDDKPQNFNISKELKSSKEETIKNLPGQFSTILHGVAENLAYRESAPEIKDTLARNLLQISLKILIDLQLRIPDFDIFSKYQNRKNDSWGDIIKKETITSFYNPLNSKIELTESQKEDRRRFASIRKLKPLVWNITIRGAIYLQMIELSYQIKNKIHSKKANEILDDIKLFLTSNDKNVFKKFQELRFRCDQTGWFESSEYFKTVEESENFRDLFPIISNSFETSSGILQDYEYKLEENGNGGFDLFYSYSVWTLKKLAKKRFPLPSKLFFEKHQVRDGNLLGDPIEIDPGLFPSF